MGLGEDKAKPAGWKARREADMSRDEAYLNAMLRELGAAYYQTLHGEGTASDVARAVDAVADAEGGRDLATEPGRSGASGDAGHHLGEETVTTQASGESERRIVVGVDGSVPSKAALAWAVKQARLTGATVEAVIAWELPATYGYPVPVPVPDIDYGGLAAEVLAGAIAEASRPGEPVKIRSTVAEGNAAGVLLDASAGAELLVVGSRGHGAFTEALLGSVGQHCVHHASCPVVVIRDSLTGP
jgi:nucleotide-binding universal stress UspA family protein